MSAKLKVNRCSQSGFTLIELLVVIAIVAVLAAILIPAIGAVKKRALVTKGVSNHKQITTAYLMYLNEHNGKLWYRSPSGSWSGGSGGLFGPQNYPSAPGYLCYLLEDYGLNRAEWNGWKEIPNRAESVWYSPAAVDLSGVRGHGATYFYYFLGTKDGDTTFGIGDAVSAKPYLRDYYGNYSNPNDSSFLYSGSQGTKLVYSYLDGHTEFRSAK